MFNLSIVAASVDSPQWAELLVKSLWKFSQVNLEIVIIDNGSLSSNLTWLREQAKLGKIRLLEQGTNIGHGGAMDLGTRVAKYPHVVHLDIDSHVMRKGWDVELFELYRSDPKIRMIGKKGPDHKPLHPPLFFYEKDFILKNNISFLHLPGISTDTAQKSYWDILNLGYKVERLEGITDKALRVYPECRGQEIGLNGKSCLFHHWCGTRFNENNPLKTKQVLRSEGWSYTLEDYLEDKKRLFSQPLVKEILRIKS